MPLTTQAIRQKYLDYFKSNGHAVINSASLLPENDPTVLFTTAGMHPLTPYLMGETHPLGTRLTSCQKCVRTGDIDEVGDRWHLTFFEMLGNWSLGDYFKKEAISMSYEFLTSKNWLGINPEKLSVTVFAGDADAPKDNEAATIWRNLGIPDERIYYYGKEHNWWGPAGTTGPCGPDTEMFYDTGTEKCNPQCDPSCSCGKYVEIWNDVFMQFNKKADGTYEELKQKNVDTGMGLERVAAIINQQEDVYSTDIFSPLLQAIRSASTAPHEQKSARIIADHVRAAVFMITDGIAPSNLDQGYVLRRLIRRALRHGKKIGLKQFGLQDLADIVIQQYQAFYPELDTNKSEIKLELVKEEEKFQHTLVKGEQQFAKMIVGLKPNAQLSTEQVFHLYDTYGFPLELTEELAKEHGLTVDNTGFTKLFKQHQAQSRLGAEKKFKGGLADASDISVRSHTATHLLQAALRQILGNHVFQKGSNITPERIRFDFSHPQKMTSEQIKLVEDLVNEQIKRALPVQQDIMNLDDAKTTGAIGLFSSKYGDKVKVYTIGDFSKEFCGGPHVNNTREIGHFKIIKEEASSAGVRRIKAKLSTVSI
ncbi:MAG: alanine--tRNA ligase [Patescibacteria group bacterium]|jgi:alanyl-tRNA synthetase